MQEHYLPLGLEDKDPPEDELEAPRGRSQSTVNACLSPTQVLLAVFRSLLYQERQSETRRVQGMPRSLPPEAARLIESLHLAGLSISRFTFVCSLHFKK